MGVYLPPTADEVTQLWHAQFGGRQQCATALKGRNLRRALATPCSVADLQVIVAALIDREYASDESINAALDRYAREPQP